MNTKSRLYLLIGLKTFSNFLIISGLTILFFFGYPAVREGISEVLFRFFQRNVQAESTFGEVFSLYTPSSFGKMLAIPPSLPVEPVNKQASIVIEKINVNTPIIFDVSVTNEKKYNQALESGVAHAKGTEKPSSKPGNTYLFAHSTLNPAQIQRYGAVFTKLKNLKKNDAIVVFFKGKRYDYLVKKTEVVKGFNTTPLLRKVSKPTLTLQTCHPPGFLKDRLIVKAELVGVY